MAKAAKRSKKDQEQRSILINFLLDKSGSMSEVRDATITGFNEFLADQQREGGHALMTLTFFDDECFTAAHAVPVSEMVALERSSYRPSGCTALFDAIGFTMGLTDDFVAKQSPDQVLFVIMTDGYENASREFTRESIFKLIDQRQESAGYEFIYLGANQDSIAASTSLGIAPGRSMNWSSTPDEARDTMKRVSHNVRAYRRQGGERVADGAFFSDAFEKSGETEYEDFMRQGEGGSA